ncbi:MAG: hypothetical protein HQL37_03830 [Alphaproteobacteria bacterium]|nr:hypothetical protein [Alphaproteobacteria bacterium]
MPSIDKPELVAAALQAAATALAGNDTYETPDAIARLAYQILEEWDKVLINRPHLSRTGRS